MMALALLLGVLARPSLAQGTFAGTYSGTYRGIFTEDGQSFPVSGVFTITVDATGHVSGSASPGYSVSGVVSPTGASTFGTAVGSGLQATFSGIFQRTGEVGTVTGSYRSSTSSGRGSGSFSGRGDLGSKITLQADKTLLQPIVLARSAYVLTRSITPGVAALTVRVTDSSGRPRADKKLKVVVRAEPTSGGHDHGNAARPHGWARPYSSSFQPADNGPSGSSSSGGVEINGTGTGDNALKTNSAGVALVR